MLLINLFSVLPAFAWENNLVSLDKTLQSLKVGDAVTLTATISPANDNSLKWSTVDVDGSNVIQLDKTKGNPVTVTALNVGTAVVTVRHGNRSATCKIIVGPTSPQSPGNTGLLVDVNADQSEITKPSDGPANDDLNITLTPTGSAPTSNRPPVDIVFVFDKSGSMGHEVGDSGLSKIDIAKNALDNAVDFFSNAKNANNDDKLALVAFDSGVYSTIPLTTKANGGFRNLKNSVDSLIPSGGTDYQIALNEAINIFKGASNDTSRKYVVFLTDGMPTNSMKYEEVNQSLIGYYYDWNWYLKSYLKPFKDIQTNVNYDTNYEPGYNKYIVSDGHKYFFPNTTIQSTEKIIMDHGKEKANELASMGIPLYSIGLGDNVPNSDVISWPDSQVRNYLSNYLNFDYLDELSKNTGVTAQQALPNDTSSLNNVFQSLIQQISSPAISDIQFKIKLPVNVSLPLNTSAHMEDGYAVVNMSDISFLADGTTPNPINDVLPLIFSATGTYTFNDMKLYYKDLNGGQQIVSITTPVTINVKSNIVAVTGITLDKSTMTLNQGQSEHLIATVLPDNATDKSVAWSSSNSSVATVDSEGNVTGIVAGNNAIITATTKDGEFMASCEVTVLPSSNAYLSSLQISAGTLSPTFIKGTTNYTNWVGNSVTTVSVTPIVEDPNATLTVTVNSKSVDRMDGANAYGPIHLNNDGPTTIKVVVTAQDGTTVKTYSVDVIKEKIALSDPFTINSTSGNSSSGNRATKVEISYNFSVPEGFELAKDSNGIIIFNPIFKIKSGASIMQVPLPKDGIDKDSTPVIKYLKSSNGYSQKLVVQGEVDLTLKSKITGEEYNFSVNSDPRDIYILSNEELQ